MGNLRAHGSQASLHAEALARAGLTIGHDAAVVGLTPRAADLGFGAVPFLEAQPWFGALKGNPTEN